MVAGTRSWMDLDSLNRPDGMTVNFGFPIWRTRSCLNLDENAKLEMVCHVPGRPSGLGWLPTGELLVVSMLDDLIFKLSSDSLVIHADLASVVHRTLNDMIVDSSGNAYVGQYGFDPTTEPARSVGLILVRRDGRAEIQPNDLVGPNGCAISADGRTLFTAESGASRLSAYAVSPDGYIHSKRVFAEFDRETMVDGICLDAEGALWVADPRGQRCVRVLDGGQVTHVIDTSPKSCVACVLGGPDRRSLFLMLYKMGTLSLPNPEECREGRIALINVDVPGIGVP